MCVCVCERERERERMRMRMKRKSTLSLCFINGYNHSLHVESQHVHTTIFILQSFVATTIRINTVI